MLHNEDEDIVTPDDDDETRLVRRNADEGTRRMRRHAVDDSRAVTPENDQTRVVDRHPVDETRVVDNVGDPGSQPGPEFDDEATQLSIRPTESSPEADPDRTQLSRRPRGERALSAASPAGGLGASSVTPGETPIPTPTSLPTRPGVVVGVSRLPEAPVGTRASYGVRAPEPVAVPIQRVDLSVGNPQVDLPATAEQIRSMGAARARRRSRLTCGVIVLATVVVAGAATAAILVISGL